LLGTHHAYDIRDIPSSLRDFTALDTVEIARSMKEIRLLSQPCAESVPDAVVRILVYDTRHRDGTFLHEFIDLVHAQIQYISNRVVIRAGMTIGRTHVGLDGKGPVFGPAMVRAYEIETHEAIHPRIVIDSVAYETFLADVRLHKEDQGTEDEAGYITKIAAHR
jgi:hypothetical protein